MHHGADPQAGADIAGAGGQVAELRREGIVDSLADFVVPTTSISEAEAAVDRILNEIREGIARNARDCP